MKSKLVIIHGSEWKKEHIEDAVQWAKTNTWVKTIWYSDSETWDHDHCQICWWKLCKSDSTEHNQGYYCSDGDNWICTECYDQFISV